MSSRFRLAAVCSALLAGCAARREPLVLLNFPENLWLVRSLNHHGVTFTLEYDKKYENFEVAPSTSAEGESLIFDFGAGHRIEHRFNTFIIGPHRFPAASGATIFVFLGRTGPWTFEYRGQPIRVERSGEWKPALFHKIHESRGLAEPGSPTEEAPPFLRGETRPVVPGSEQAATVSRTEYEELRVLRHHVIIEPGVSSWKVNRLTVQPDPGQVLVLRDDGSVRLSPR
jgi:hypothetical protein